MSELVAESTATRNVNKFTDRVAEFARKLKKDGFASVALVVRATAEADGEASGSGGVSGIPGLPFTVDPAGFVKAARSSSVGEFWLSAATEGADLAPLMLWVGVAQREPEESEP